MIILFYNKHKDIKIKYHNNIISSEKSEKKLKKIQEGTDVHGCAGTGGGGGDAYNVFKRSFASLYMALTRL